MKMDFDVFIAFHGGEDKIVLDIYTNKAGTGVNITLLKIIFASRMEAAEAPKPGGYGRLHYALL